MKNFRQSQVGLQKLEIVIRKILLKLYCLDRFKMVSKQINF